MHYSRWKVHGTPHGPARVQQAATCATDGCDLRPLAKNLCRKHYYAAKRPPRQPREPRPMIDCSVPNCLRAATARGWCGSHYQRWRRFGDPQFQPPAPIRVCSVADCTNVPNARNLCHYHYYQWLTYGDPSVSKNAPRRRLSERVSPLEWCRSGP